MWMQNLKSNELQQSMEDFSKLIRSKSREAVKRFLNYVLKEYYNGVDHYGNHIEESDREESFERRWNKVRAIFLKSI